MKSVFKRAEGETISPRHNASGVSAYSNYLKEAAWRQHQHGGGNDAQCGNVAAA